MSATVPQLDIPADASRRLALLAKWFPTFAAVYFALHLILRIIDPRAMEIDEAEQIILSQWWSLVYGAQPPLYTWLQKIVFLITGPSVIGLSLLKNLLLWLTCVFLYICGRTTFQNPVRAAMAAMAVLLIPQVSWESQRDLTHTVLVTCTATATLASLARLVRTRSWSSSFLFGVCLGLGVLAKYNFIYFAGAILLGIISTRSGRRILLDRRIGLTVAIASSLIAIHLVPLLSQLNVLDAGLNDVRLETSPNPRRTGFIDLFIAIPSGVGLLVLVFGGLFPRAIFSRQFLHSGRTLSVSAPAYIATALILVSGTIVLFAVSEVKTRWLQPLMPIIPLFLTASIPSAMLTIARVRTFATIIAITAVSILMASTVRSTSVSVSDFDDAHLYPFEEMANALNREIGQIPPLLLSDEEIIAGNLLCLFRATAAYVPNVQSEEFLRQSLTDDVLIVWIANNQPRVPGELEDVLGELNKIAPRHESRGTIRVLYGPDSRNEVLVAYLFLTHPI